MHKKLLCFSLFLIYMLCTFATYSQEKKGGNFDLGADNVSRYVWRDTDKDYR